MVRKSRSRYAVLLAVVALLVVAGDASALKPHERDGWVLNLAYGNARGKATFGPASPIAAAETEDGVSPAIRLGHMVGGKVALGVSYVGWMYETGAFPTKYRFSFQNIMATASWYPGNPERAIGGLFLRGSVGLAWSAVVEVPVVPGEEQGHGDRQKNNGVGVEFCLGYEFRVARHVAVGLSASLIHQQFGDDIYDTATFVPVALDLGFYW